MSATPSAAPTSAAARQLLEQGLQRLALGGRKLSLLLLACFAASKLVHTCRFLDIADTGDLLRGLLSDLVGLAILALVIYLLLPRLLRGIYHPLLEHGTVAPAQIVSGTNTFSQRFAGMGTQPYMLRGALAGIERLIGGWLPTRAVNFRVAGARKSLHTGALYADETPGAHALVALHKPRHAWLIRQHQGDSS